MFKSDENIPKTQLSFMHTLLCWQEQKVVHPSLAQQHPQHIEAQGLFLKH